MQAMLSASDAIDRVLRTHRTSVRMVVRRAGGGHLLGRAHPQVGLPDPRLRFDPASRNSNGTSTALLFLSWLGYAYIRNVHVRIDVFTPSKTPRQQAKLEVFGILVFAIPYCLVATYFAFLFAHVSFLQNERSDAPNGLEYRWIMKGCLFLGLVLARPGGGLGPVAQARPAVRASRSRRARLVARGQSLRGDGHGMDRRPSLRAHVSRAHVHHVRGLSGGVRPGRRGAWLRRARHRSSMSSARRSSAA